jgi:hypothetical protein
MSIYLGNFRLHLHSFAGSLAGLHIDLSSAHGNVREKIGIKMAQTSAREL